MYTNARSMGNKQEELEAIVQQESYDIVAITETWWDDSYDWSAAMCGYKLFRKDRQGRRGGGVALYVRESLVSVKLEVISHKVECLWTRIRGKFNKADILVGVCYRPPNQDDEGDDLFYKQLADVSKSTALVFVGDLNLPDICWELNTAPKRQSRKFLECIEDNFRHQLVNEPTRGKTPLDLLFTNTEGLVGDVVVGGRLGHSDHEIIEFSILRGARRTINKTSTVDFRRADFCLFRSLVQSIPWETMLKNKGGQEGWTCFKQVILSAQEQAIPVCRKASWRGRQPAWLNREILNEIRNKKRLYRLWKKGLATYEEFMEIARSCRKNIRETKVQFEVNLANSVRDNKKSFFKYVNNKRRGKENLHSLLDSEGNIVNKDEEKAEVLNTYFASVFTSKTGGPQDNSSLEVVDRDRKPNRPLVFQEEIVGDLLSHLDPHKSMGPDEIHPRVMRELAEELAKPLSIIFQQSWLTGEVPYD
ncbi:uncharacterized protein LOC135578557 [Columba livia]|uniref:uncharacterized protein LOC135578557 n=1 Tax=Columba livia TaxID=8932 RepID=UPI0031BB58A8